MNYLLIAAAIVVIISNFYIFNFQGSIEGNDERGKIIQLKMTKVMYSILFLGTIAILVVNAINIISSQLAIYLIFAVVLLNSVSGSIYLFAKKA